MHLEIWWRLLWFGRANVLCGILYSTMLLKNILPLSFVFHRISLIPEFSKHL